MVRIVKAFGGVFVAAAVASTLSVLPAMADKVTLKSLDGSVAMTGDLVEFDGETYVLRTLLGQVTIQADEVECEGACPELSNVDFTLSGSNTIGKSLIPGLFESFAGGFGLSVSQQPSDAAGVDHYAFTFPDGSAFANVDIYAFGSELAFKALLDGSAEIVMSTREVRPDEAQALIDAGLGDPQDASNQIVAALDGIVILTGPGNPVRSLSIDEIARIFSGQITNWLQVGGPDLPITLYRRDDDSGTTADFVSTIFGNTGRIFAAKAQTYDSDEKLVSAVAGDPAAIGFTSLSAKGDHPALAVRGTCGFISEPSEFTIKTGEYLLARRVYFYTSSVRNAQRAPDRNEKMTGFLNFVQSQDAQTVISDAGFVNQSIAALPIEAQGRRLINSLLDTQNDATFRRVQKVISELSAADRLSSTFRFKAGVAELDAQAVGDIPRLAEYLRNIDLTGKEVVLAGFSDSAGTGGQNEALSLRRAGQVMDALRTALGTDAGAIPMVAIGFGEVAPLGCNDSERGRAINRRVEVWIRQVP